MSCCQKKSESNSSSVLVWIQPVSTGTFIMNAVVTSLPLSHAVMPVCPTWGLSHLHVGVWTNKADSFRTTADVCRGQRLDMRGSGSAMNQSGHRQRPLLSRGERAGGGQQAGQSRASASEAR